MGGVEFEAEIRQQPAVLARLAVSRAAKMLEAGIGDREPIVLRSHGIGFGFATRYNIRIPDDNRAYLEKLCNKLIAAGGACVVLRNGR